MRKFRFNKLVRDKILTNMLKSPSENPKYHKMNDSEFLTELKKKLVEEASELEQSKPEQVAEELADVIEIIRNLQETLAISDEAIEELIKKKLAKVGGFSDRIFIDFNEVEDDCEWIEYYLSQSEKYPEIS